MPTFTNGFSTNQDLTDHYDKHVLVQGEFPAVTSEQEYEDLADTFLGDALDANTLEGFRAKKDGSAPDVIRYNTVTQEYGIITNGGTIKSYYIADPAEHGFPSNLDYFNWDIARMR